jgi:hypothetical protein
MTSRAESLGLVVSRKLRQQTAVEVTKVGSTAWDPERFATDQLRNLVHQIFPAGTPQARRLVVFSAVDPQTEVRELCLRVGQILAERAGKSVCLLDTHRVVPACEGLIGGKTSDPVLNHRVSGILRDSSRQNSSGVWLVSNEVFWGETSDISSAETLGRRLDRLRKEFDYCVVQAPAAGSCETAGRLGRLSDGVILVLEANSTRRWAAQRAQASLQAAHARLLGTVLSERTFPIPEQLYRRL